MSVPLVKPRTKLSLAMKKIAKGEKDGLTRERKTSAERIASRTNAVPGDIKAIGKPAAWETSPPSTEKTNSLKLSGTLADGFDRAKRHQFWMNLRDELKEERSDVASPIAIASLRASAEILAVAFDKFEKDAVSKEKDVITAVSDYMKWVYAQGLAQMDPADIMRWDRRCNDRLLSADMYNLFVVAKYLNITFLQLITPDVKPTQH